MTYTVKEIFYTLQGEGVNTGRAAVFCRFSGCNLWSGREVDRATSTCTFCDTDFVGIGPDGGRFSTADALADAIQDLWPWDIEGRSGQLTGPNTGRPLVVCTGGEPLLQLDAEAIDALHIRGFEVAVETNGTKAAPHGIDHICVSPKADAPLVVTRGSELKLVYPQSSPLAHPERFLGLEFEHFFLQPMDGPDLRDNTAQALAYCLANPRWRLSVQTHKTLGIR